MQYISYSMGSCGKTVQNIVMTMNDCLLAVVDFPTKKLYTVFDVSVPHENIIGAIESVGFSGTFISEYEFDQYLFVSIFSKPAYININIILFS